MKDCPFVWTVAICCWALRGDSVTADGLRWQRQDGFRWAEVSPVGTGAAGFSKISSHETSISFTNHLSRDASLRNRLLENGSGVAAGDFDGDGRCDLYLCQLEGPNALYRNLGGWRFEEVSRSVGVTCDGQFSSGAVFADVDGDGDLDLLVAAMGGGVRLFINGGGGAFLERIGSGLNRTSGATTLALADIDIDGDLDLYVANYRAQTVKDFPIDFSRLKLVGGRWQLPEELADRFVSAVDITGRAVLHESGEPDALYLNDGKGRFREVSWVDGRFMDEDGLSLRTPPLDWSLSAMFRDINGDGLPDLFVCSDFVQPDRFWINQGNGRFRALARDGLTKTSRLSMGVDFGDLNRDGFDDFFVVDMLSPNHELRVRHRTNLTPAMHTDYTRQHRQQFMRNTLFKNRGDGTFAEIAQLAGVQASDWSWSTVFLDVDLDGFEDILVANGSMHDAQDLDVQNQIDQRRASAPQGRLQYAGREWMRPLRTPNYAFRNRGMFEFEEMGNAWGFASTNIAQGMALADLDNDGDQDVIVTTLNTETELYRNDGPAKRVAVRLRGQSGNTEGIGARIRAVQDGFVQAQEIISGGRYLSGDASLRVFAVDQSRGAMDVHVSWAGGSSTVVRGVIPNRIYEIAEGKPVAEEDGETQGAASENARSKSNKPLFKDVSDLLDQRHSESIFDDGEVQALLERQFSRQGPSILASDLDDNGFEDLILGNGAGHPPDLFLNRDGKRFQQLDPALDSSLFAGDQVSWTAYDAGDGEPKELLCSISNYENAASATNAVLRFGFTAGRLTPLPPIPGWGDTVGPICASDVDHDGAPDLFVGGRLRPGRYPESASSRLFLRKNGAFIPDRENSEIFRNLGLVNDAVFGDLDGDGWLDLVCACEWGPIRVFLNHAGRFVDATSEFGFHKLSGWWTSVAVADLDNNGQLDVVAGNWGRNTKFQVHMKRPIGIVFGELRTGTPFFHALTYYAPELDREVPFWDRDAFAGILPEFLERFPTHADYGRAGIRQLLGEDFAKAARKEARTSDSMVFLNRGGIFQPIALPLEAQVAPSFGIAVADFSGDGNPDIFLNQNFSFTELETSPNNDGVGALLIGDGKGGFTAMRPAESGISITGDGRGCAPLDWNRDGRVDLVVGQNNQRTRLFLNRSGATN